MTLIRSLRDQGYAVVPALLRETEASSIASELLDRPIESAGTRNLLDMPWCRALAQRLRSAPGLRDVLPANAVAVQCTLFDKTPERNWLVALHQDPAIPAKQRVEHPQLGAWSVKEGQHFVHPPAELLEQMLAVRLHIDDCGPDNGPVRVVPGSHRMGLLSPEQAQALRDATGEVSCTVARGGALLFRPLLLHASSKATLPTHRRVLHFLFGPPSIGYGLQWAHMA